MTAVLCVNGTHKLPVMVIGSAKRPRSGLAWPSPTVAVIRACSDQDVEDADDSTVVIPWTLSLSQARAGSAEMKTFFHENQGEHPELRKNMDAVEGIEKLLERMTFFARSKQTNLFQHALTAVSAADQPEPAGRP